MNLVCTFDTAQLGKIFVHYINTTQVILKILLCKKPDMYININLVVEFQRWWVLKSKIFGQESINSKDFFTSVNELRFQKVLLFNIQSQFSMPKIN